MAFFSALKKGKTYILNAIDDLGKGSESIKYLKKESRLIRDLLNEAKDGNPDLLLDSLYGKKIYFRRFMEYENRVQRYFFHIWRLVDHGLDYYHEGLTSEGVSGEAEHQFKELGDKVREVEQKLRNNLGENGLLHTLIREKKGEAVNDCLDQVLETINLLIQLLKKIVEFDVYRDNQLIDQVYPRLSKEGKEAFQIIFKNKALSDSDGKRVSAMEHLLYHDRSLAIPIFERLLCDMDPEIRRDAIRDLRYLKSIKSTEKILKMVKDFSWLVRDEVLCFVIEMRLKEEVPLLEKSLEDPSDHVRRTALLGLGKFNSIKSIPAIKKLLESEDYRPSRTDAAVLLYKMTGDVKYHRLYYGEKESFFVPGRKGSLGEIKRRKFDKTGSELTLLGGNAVGKIIARKVSANAFNAWKLVYDAKKAWRDAGFDYIPVEPIIRFRQLKDGRYLVFTKVLGLSVVYHRVFGEETKLGFYHGGDAYINSIQSNDFITNQERTILGVLNRLGIKHGHAHEFNFCVEQNDGKLRLYIIDFDQAVNP